MFIRRYKIIEYYCCLKKKVATCVKKVSTIFAVAKSLCHFRYANWDAIFASASLVLDGEKTPLDCFDARIMQIYD